ncbi:MAG: sodium:calcium antiporter [Myxococcota bacterium]|nr:sodium:calcium antiporter [Myxococcota bacterium]
MLFAALGTVVLASIVIMYACDPFEDASGYLGRNMPAGVKGATINAIASSLPELLTATFLLFAFKDEDGFSGGVATCAGSAVFNAVIIPAVSVMAVMFIGVKQPDGTRKKVAFIELDKGTVLRDGAFFVLAELALIYFLGDTTLTWWMGGALIAIYLVYFSFLMWQFKTGRAVPDEDDDDDEDEDDDEDTPLWKAALTFDFNTLLFGGKDFTTGSAWVVLGLATTVIGIACYFLSWAVVETAHQLDVPLYFTTVILAAAATSVPDTVISVRDAMNGNYDDAVANAVGSNIFDICVALGLPLLAYGLVYGNIELAHEFGDSADVQVLRIGLLVVTGIVLTLFLAGKKVGRGKALTLFALYFGWLGFVLYRAAQVSGIA